MRALSFSLAATILFSISSFYHWVLPSRESIMAASRESRPWAHSPRFLEGDGIDQLTLLPYDFPFTHQFGTVPQTD